MKDKKYIKWAIEITVLIVIFLLLWCIFVPMFAFLPICDSSDFCCSLNAVAFNAMGLNSLCPGYGNGDNGDNGDDDSGDAPDVPGSGTCRWDNDLWACIGSCTEPTEECTQFVSGGDIWCDCIVPQGNVPCVESEYPECEGYCDDMSGYRADCISETWDEWGIPMEECHCNYTVIPSSELPCEDSSPYCDGYCDDPALSCTLIPAPMECVCFHTNPPTVSECQATCQAAGYNTGYVKWGGPPPWECKVGTVAVDECCCFNLHDGSACDVMQYQGGTPPSWCCDSDGANKNNQGWCMDNTGLPAPLTDSCAAWGGDHYTYEWQCVSFRCQGGFIVCDSGKECSNGACAS